LVWLVVCGIIGDEKYYVKTNNKWWSWILIVLCLIKKGGRRTWGPGVDGGERDVEVRVNCCCWACESHPFPLYCDTDSHR
jgi:hypothetical protein